MSSAASRKGSKKDGVGGGLVCAHCKKVGELDTMKRCGRCHLAYYCSVACQKIHWKIGGHKRVCRKQNQGGSNKSSTASDGVRASGGSDAPLQHPCPVCLDTEDDDLHTGMCNSCGQMFCGSCSKNLLARQIPNCPTCRAVLNMTAEDKVRRVRQLLARSDGRHTRIAQFTLAVCYADGTGVDRDEAEAVRWYRLAADQGHVGAQYNTAGCYGTGTGVVQDEAEAARWYLRAANQGDAGAQLNIGLSYAKGTGVVQDEAEAVRWLRLAADQGKAAAQLSMGVCFAHGTGVIKDEAEAVRWFRLAADQGDASAQRNLGVHYENGTGVVRDIAEARRWFRLAAE